jgi:hypothetical protein
VYITGQVDVGNVGCNLYYMAYYTCVLILYYVVIERSCWHIFFCEFYKYLDISLA